ncbi:formylglycine-generating enzyme family protein, partial [Candidatus Kaiserbacteria bacterium]|nr:formylglycine-generating enzyme family protein [Candidatus Kaiserbacteria bacterium]
MGTAGPRDAIGTCEGMSAQGVAAAVISHEPNRAPRVGCGMTPVVSCMLPRMNPKVALEVWAEVIEAEVAPAVVTNATLRDAIKATGLPWRVRDKGTNIEMLLIPPGEFVMGKSRGDDAAGNDELPAHEVKLTKAFYLGRYEVTQQQYARVTKLTPSHFSHPAKPTVPTLEALMADGADQSGAEWVVFKAKEKLNAWVAMQQQPASDAKGEEWPVEKVSWDECAAFCKKAGFRLPTEAEWEYACRACRAGTRTPRYGELGEIAWYNKNSNDETKAVGTKQANALGLHDMLGNVWEWVNDWYGRNYSADAQTNPQG